MPLECPGFGDSQPMFPSPQPNCERRDDEMKDSGTLLEQMSWPTAEGSPEEQQRNRNNSTQPCVYVHRSMLCVLLAMKLVVSESYHCPGKKITWVSCATIRKLDNLGEYSFPSKL